MIYCTKKFARDLGALVFGVLRPNQLTWAMGMHTLHSIIFCQNQTNLLCPLLCPGLRKEEVVARYFDMLDDDDILALYDIYQDDFKMFGYQFQFRGLRLNMP